MTETRTARLARIRVANPLWTIRPVRSGTGYTAHYCASRTRLWAPDLTGIETQLWQRCHKGPNHKRI